jgi:hypothetical protein
MSHALITIAAPIAVGRISDALAVIEAMGNPASPQVAEALDRLDGDEGVHFMSLHAIPPTDEGSGTGHLVLEFSADGSETDALARVVDRIGPRLIEVFRLADDWKSGDLVAYLGARRLVLGVGWSGRTGLAFVGTPGMSVGRIRREAELARRLTASLEAQDGARLALDRLNLIRAQLRADPAGQWALETPEPMPVAPVWTTFSLIIDAAVSFVRTFLWPFAILWGLIILARVLYLVANHAFAHVFAASPMIVIAALWSGLLWALGALLAIAIPLLLLAGALYLNLRKLEQTDWLSERAPERAVMHEILARENHYAQNHMMSLTRRKPGFTRRLTVRLAFWLIGTLARLQFQPGHLGDIGTIHFARWVLLPNSRDFVFFSNFGGSWESYLEDFITKAHEGLTAVWSNTVGFPRTENLFQKGATDGERFKRYARQSMLPTPFWFSAYPTVTTDNIRTNAAIRVGVAAAMTNDEAIEWLDLFGSADRPAAQVQSDQIQSLVFGGLGFLPHGCVLIVRFADNRVETRAWLASILPHVAFDDGRLLRAEAVISLGLGPQALAKAGLPISTA